MMNYMHCIAENLKYLIELENCNQKQFAKKWEISEASLSNYISEGCAIKLELLTKLQQEYHFSIDDFLSKDFKKMTNPVRILDQNNDNISRYHGLYSLYYFDSAAGGSAFNNKDQLLYGLLYLYPEENILKLQCEKALAVFGLSLTKLKECWEMLNTNRLNPDVFINYDFGNNTYFYQGDLKGLKNVINITLTCGSRDAIVISLTRPGGVLPYIGGLGLGCSVTRGLSKVPCCQYIAMTRGLVLASPGKISEFLSFSNIIIRSDDDCQKLLRRINEYFNPYHNDDDFLDSDEKELLVKHNLEQLIQDIVFNSSLKYEKYNTDMDYQWYQFIKRYV